MTKRNRKTAITHFLNADGSYDVFKDEKFFMTMKADKFERFIELCKKSTNYKIPQNEQPKQQV